MPWDLAGNADTQPPGSFLGTVDAQPLVIKTNGTEALRIAVDGVIQSQGSLELYDPLPYIDFHFGNSSQDWNVRLINNADRRLTIDANVASFTNVVEARSMELFAPTPNIDFHFGNSPQDWNVRLINDATGQLSLVAGRVRLAGSLVFADGTTQSTATRQGPEGPPGPQGVQGPPGRQQFVVCANPTDFDDGICNCGPVAALVTREQGPCVISTPGAGGPATCSAFGGGLHRGSCCLCE